MTNANNYRIDELIIFVIRNGFARIIMSVLLVVCYARAICQKQQLWILTKLCYIGLAYLIIDWWIILLKIRVHRRVVEYFWINSGVAIFIMCKCHEEKITLAYSESIDSYNAAVVVLAI